jgi:hypothetical protein
MSDVLKTKWDDLPYTNYPSKVDDPILMADITSDDLPLVNQYESYLAANNFAAAAKILADNPSLDAKFWNAKKVNTIDNRTVAMERTINNLLQDYLISRLTYISEYDSTATYNKTNIVSFNGEGFMCRVDGTSGISPVSHTTTEKWALISKQGIQGVSGTGLAPRGIWNSTTQYYTNDCCVYDNAIWQAMSDSLNSTPSDSNSNWLKLLVSSISEDYIIAVGVGQAAPYAAVKADQLKTPVSIGKANFDGTKSIALQEMFGNSPLSIADGGTGASNSDDACAKLGASKLFGGTATLTSASWSGSSAPYSYVLPISGLKSTDTVYIDCVTGQDTSSASAIKAAWALTANYGLDALQAAGQITMYASAKPTINIPVRYTVWR